MATKEITVKCPHCGSEKVSKNGHNKTGKQVYNCNNPECEHRNFVEEYTYRAYKPDLRKQVLKMALIAPEHVQPGASWAFPRIRLVQF